MQAAHVNTPIGIITLIFDEELNLIEIKKSANFIQKRSYPKPVINLINLINAYFLGEIFKIDYPFKLRNLSEFDLKVLNFICETPFGHTVSYKWIAKKLQTSPRAVGQALKRNPLPIIIPCHRVIKSNGELGGYSLGVETKKWLVEHEKTILYKLRLHKI